MYQAAMKRAPINDQGYLDELQAHSASSSSGTTTRTP